MKDVLRVKRDFESYLIFILVYSELSSLTNFNVIVFSQNHDVLRSKHLVYFLMADQWVILNELGLVGCAIIEWAVVSFGMPVRRTVHISALAFDLYQAYFLFALPAQFLVCL